MDMVCMLFIHLKVEKRCVLTRPWSVRACVRSRAHVYMLCTDTQSKCFHRWFAHSCAIWLSRRYFTYFKRKDIQCAAAPGLHIILLPMYNCTPHHRCELDMGNALKGHKWMVATKHFFFACTHFRMNMIRTNEYEHDSFSIYGCNRKPNWFASWPLGL